MSDKTIIITDRNRAGPVRGSINLEDFELPLDTPTPATDGQIEVLDNAGINYTIVGGASKGARQSGAGAGPGGAASAQTDDTERARNDASPGAKKPAAKRTRKPAAAPAKS